MITRAKKRMGMSIRKFIWIEIFSILLLSHNMFSQIILQGTVSDNGGEYLGSGAEPVVGALVKITDQIDTSRVFSSFTDQKGKYSIQIIETGVDNDVSKFPNDFRLLQNYPNPFNPTTVIAYELNKPSYMKIEMYNVLGQRVKTLFDGFQSSSGHIIWNATNDMEQVVPAGMYICSMASGGIRINRKLLLLNGWHTQMFTTPVNVGYAKETEGHTLKKQVTNLYLLEITGENIAPYKQQNLEITADMTVDISVRRVLIDIDSNIYKTVKIGDQWWMAENLKVTKYRNFDQVPQITSDRIWASLDLSLSSDACCSYNNDETNAAVYGRLYNWYAVNDKRNIAPDGWHVPSDEEWKQLEMFLGMSRLEVDTIYWRGTNEGGKLKEAGYSNWRSPNTGATNEYGFAALPGGYRSYDGYFSFIGYTTHFWSSTERDSSYAWHRYLTHDHANLARLGGYKPYGHSVRCVRDQVRPEKH